MSEKKTEKSWNKDGTYTVETTYTNDDGSGRAYSETYKSNLLGIAEPLVSESKREWGPTKK